MNVVFDIVMWILLFSLCLVAIRLIRGPSMSDRAVAADQAAIHGVALIAVFSAVSQQPILLDILIVTAIVGFLTIAVIGIFIERSARGKTGRNPRETSL
jgi:multicomponent Na+:H+ antiporter subunit F